MPGQAIGGAFLCQRRIAGMEPNPYEAPRAAAEVQPSQRRPWPFWKGFLAGVGVAILTVLLYAAFFVTWIIFDPWYVKQAPGHRHLCLSLESRSHRGGHRFEFLAAHWNHLPDQELSGFSVVIKL
jgi:hypothetical protein